jgi:hypothetical protein
VSDLPAVIPLPAPVEPGCTALDTPAALPPLAVSERKAAPWRGRKRVADARGRFVAVRCTDTEYEKLNALAERAGVSVGPYLRAVALSSPVPRTARRPTVERVALAQVLGALGRVGSNVNQLARVANTTGELPPAETLKDMGDEIRAMRAALMKALGRGN